MKRNNLKWALPLAALCMLTTACSKDNETDPTDGKTRSLTISCGIGETDSKADTRASVEPNNPDVTKGEKFIWHKWDRFYGYLCSGDSEDFIDLDGVSGLTDSDTKDFSIDENYDDAKPSNVASFTCKNFPSTGSYRMLATYQFGGTYSFSPTGNPGELVFNISNGEKTQIGKNDTRHLAIDMCMYATAAVTDKNVPNLTFHHLTSLFRFTVTNNNSSACRISSISVKNSSGNRIFGTHYTFHVTDWNKGTIETTNSNANDVNASSIELKLQDATDATKGIELSGTGDSFDAYTITGPRPSAPLTGEKLEFVITVTDTDGNNPRTYTSLALDANDIINNETNNNGATTWEMGKRYWFNLVLDDNVVLESCTISSWGQGEGGSGSTEI